MSRHPTKLNIDEVPTLSIYNLYQAGLLAFNHTQNLSISMTNGFGNSCSIGITIHLNKTIILGYTIRGTQPEECINTEVGLITQNCNYGGQRFWFSCPRCHSRVGKLYLFGKYFVCRGCGDLTYQSKNIKLNTYLSIFYYCLDKEKKLSELENSIRRKYYKNKPTKKYKQYQKMFNQLHKYDSLLARMHSNPHIYF